MDRADDGAIFGTLNTRNLSDRFFITEDSNIRLSGAIAAENIELAVGFGGLGLAIQNGNFNVAIDTGLSLVDPGTGVNDDARLTLNEIFDNSITSLVSLDTPTFRGGGRLPIVGQGELAGVSVNDILGIDPNHPFTEAIIPELSEPVSDGPEILIDIGGPTDIQITTNEQFDQIITNFQHFSIDNVCDGILQIIDLLHNSDIAILNTEIPLINQSVNELLAPDSILRDVINVLCIDFDTLKAEVEELVAQQLDLAAPSGDEAQGAIPAIFSQLNDQQRAKLGELRDALSAALGTTSGNVADLASRLAGAVQGFRSFIDELPNTINTSQLNAAINQIEKVLPSADGLADRVRDALG